jgi:hypothetical protein
MKKLFTTVLLGLLISSISYATITSNTIMRTEPKKSLFSKTETLKLVDYTNIAVSSKNNTIQAGSKLADVAAIRWMNFLGYTNPIAYEPISKTLTILDANFSGTSSFTGKITLRTTQNNGSTWNTPRVAFNKAGQLCLFPSLAVTNPTKGTTPTDLLYYICSPIYDGSGAPQANSRAWIITKTGLDSVVINTPETNPDQVDWFDANAVASSAKNGSYGYSTAMLSYKVGANYGQYGFSATDLTAKENYSYIPATWALSNFKTSDQPSSTYNGEMRTDVDSKGNIYTGVLNIYQKGETDFRAPAVSKSTDNGETWSDWDIMPKSALLDFGNEIQSPDASKCVFVAYNQNGFVVTGEDSFSFLLNVWVYTGVGTDGKDAYSLVVADCSKENGSWKMRAISAINGNLFRVIQNVGNATFKDSLVDSPRDLEFQLSRTADGKYLVAKWLDYTKFVQHASVTLQSGQVIDSSIITDIVTAYRLVGDNQWSKPLVQTNDDIPDKFTFIPSIVPDINNVPCVAYRTGKSTTTSLYNGYPEAVRQKVIDFVTELWYYNMDLVGGTIDVNETTENYNFSINSISPNPASDIAEINFTVNNPSNVKLEIYNNMGQLVKVLLNGRVNLGSQALNARIDDVPNGTYFLKLSEGGKSITKNLVVIH